MCVCVSGPATVEIFGGSTFSVNTTEKLQINGAVDGQPDPDVTLFKLEADLESMIRWDHPRITVNFMDTGRLSICVTETQVNDGGTYRIRATNENGGNHKDFTIVAVGKCLTVSI